jgi:TorA maturation chaperone TorD
MITEDYLAARQYLYVLFQSLFGNEPSEKQLTTIDAGIAREAFEVMAIEEAGWVARFLSLITDLPNLDDLRSEYTQLMIGPDKLQAPPWESVYASRERVLFTRTTLEVRNFYRSQGFIAAKYPHVADDHLAIELDFLAQLAGRAQKEPAGEKEVALSASLEFLTAHLLEWLSRYTEDLVNQQNDRNGTGFYAAAACALLAFAQTDVKVLRKQINQS